MYLVDRVRDRTSLTDALDITPAYLRNSNSDAGAVVDYRNWQLPLGRRFRSLKIYFMLRSFGVAGFQKHQRRLVDLGAEFESLVLGNPAHFELFTPRCLSLVVFRLIFDKPSFPSEEQEIKIDSLNREFFARIIKREDMHVTATVVAGCYCIRVAIGSPFTRSVHVNTVWDIIQEIAEQARAHLVTE
jgi:aromatic-L-amino-acid decarboxylase